eukprot:TRINITY_DN9111_c0_g1_i1.p1 TRINITY_DN9111_c0_g1~~TRINITY_DN9111_c0_g1_i1.p1  ORF type:complete len:148 (-),score=42.68 TRINITY_DN9111_c0_g1_i1:205-648(-)
MENNYETLMEELFGFFHEECKLDSLSILQLSQSFLFLGFEDKVIDNCINHQIDGKVLKHIIKNEIDFFKNIWQRLKTLGNDQDDGGMRNDLLDFKTKMLLEVDHLQFLNLYDLFKEITKKYILFCLSEHKELVNNHDNEIQENNQKK